jgi:hypothetical protein
LNHPWFTKELDENISFDIWTVTEQILTDLSWYEQLQKYYASLYHGYPVIGFKPGEWRPAEGGEGIGNKNTWYKSQDENHLRAVTDTVVAKLTSQPPSPMILTASGSETTQQSSKKAEMYVLGVLDHQQANALTRKMMMFAAIFGLAAAYITSDDDEPIKLELCLPGSILVDEQLCLDGKPLSLYYRMWIPKAVLQTLYPDKEDEIEAAPLYTYGTTSNTTALPELVEVRQGWRLGVGGKPGRHVVCVENVTLVHEDFTDKEFPFIFLRWKDSLAGFYGTGLVSELAPLQETFNFFSSRIRDNIQMNCESYLLVKIGDDAGLKTNKARQIVRYKDTKPEIVTPQPVHQMLFNYLAEIKDGIYGTSGVSQLSSRGEKAPGITAAVALRTLQDIESQRFSLQSLNFQELYISLTKRILEVASHHDKEIVYADKNSFEKIRFSDMDIDTNNVVVRIHAVSGLPQTPAARQQSVTEMLQAGIIAPEQAQRLLNFPDMEKFNEFATVKIDYIHWSIEEMISTGKYIAPEFDLPLTDCIDIAGSYKRLLQMRRADPNTIDLLNRYINDAKTLFDQINAPPPAAPPPQTLQPGMGDLASPIPALPANMQPPLIPPGQGPVVPPGELPPAQS